MMRRAKTGDEAGLYHIEGLRRQVNWLALDRRVEGKVGKVGLPIQNRKKVREKVSTGGK